jgi:hypothetical protein
MTRPVRIPATVLRVLREQERKVREFNPSHARDLLEIAHRTAARLERLLPTVSRSYSKAEIRTKLLHARALVAAIGERFGIEVGDTILKTYRAGAATGRGVLREQLAALVKDGVLSSDFAPAIQTTEAAALLDRGLLEMHAVSVQTYGKEAVTLMRQSMAEAMIAGETIAQTTLRMSSQMANIFGADGWRAERIIRTEHSFAVHRRSLLDFKSTMGDDAADWRKQLIATFDKRTGQDSVFVHGQVRKIDDNFEDNIGHSYPYPPNRPNDRETVIYLPLDMLQAEDAAVQ